MEAKKRLCWLGRFGHRLDPWRLDEGEFESRLPSGWRGGRSISLRQEEWFG